MDETSPGPDVAKSSDDDLLDKFQKMQAYLPVLEIMINMLKNRSDKPRQAQLEKIRYVKKLIVERKWTTADSLRKCESLLRNYWMKFKDQLDKIPDIVFESNDGTVLSVKTDSSTLGDSSQDSSQRIDQNCTQSKKEEKVMSPLNSPKNLERHDSVYTRTAVSESRRKNRNPVQKFVHNNRSVERSKSPTERIARSSSSLSPVHENVSSKKTDVWQHTHKDVGSSKYIDSNWRELDRHNSKDSHSGNLDLHKSRQKHYSIVNNGGHSTKYTESHEVASPKYISPDRKSSGGRKSDFSETSRFPEHLESNRNHLHNARYDSSKSNAKKEAVYEKETIKNYLQKDESDKKLDHNVSDAKKSSNNMSIQVLPLDVNCVNDRPECVSDLHVNSKSISSDGSSCNSSTNILGKMTEEELKKLVTDNLSNLPTLPPETKCILETIKQCSVKQGSDEVVSLTENNPGARSDFESVHPPNSDNCQKIFQPSSRDPRRHSKDGQVENMGRCGLLPTLVENANHLSVQSHHSNNDILMNKHNFIPVITQMENFSNRQGYLSHTGQIDNMPNIQPIIPITPPVEQRNTLVPHIQQLENVGGADYLLPKSPVENMGKMPLLPLPVPQFNNIGNKSSPRDPRRCIQDSNSIVPDGPHQIPNVCVQPSVFQGDCRTHSAPMLNIQPLLPEPILNRIDYCHGIQPPVPYQTDMSHLVRSFSGNNSSACMPMNTQHQVFRPSYTGLPAPRSMELSGYGRPNLQTIVPATPPVFNNRPSGVPKIQAPVSNRPTSTPTPNNQEGGQNARKKVFNSWLAIDPRNSSKLPSQMAGRSKYSQNSCKFQRPLNNSFFNPQQKGGEKSTFDKRKQDDQKDSNTTKSSSYNSKRLREGEKDSSKKKTDTHSRQKSGSNPNSSTLSKSLFGAVIVSKDGKGKDIPTKFRIPKLKKPENSDVSEANESKNSYGKSEDDVVHQMQLLFEKSLESDEVKKKIVEAIRSTLGMEVKEKNCDSNKERLNSEVKVKDAIIGCKSENKEMCKKVSKATKTTEKKIKKYIYSSSDEDKNEVSVMDDLSREKTAGSEKMSKKKNEQKKRPMVMSSDSSCDEKAEKSSATKVSNTAEGRKTNLRNLRNKSGNVDKTKTTENNIVNAGKEVSQGSCTEKCKDDANENLEDELSSVTVDVEGGKKYTKRVRCESESSLVNEKLNDSTFEVGNISASKRTRKSEDSLKNANDSLFEETKPNSVTNIDIQNLSKEKDKQKKRASDVIVIGNIEDLTTKKRRKSQIETQACNKQSEVVNLPQKVPKKMTERKKIKEVVLNATDSSNDGQNVSYNGTNEREVCLKTAKSRKSATSKGSSGSSAEESFDSTYSDKTCEKENVRATRNSLGDSEELVEKISSKKLKKKRLMRKKSKVITDDSSEEEASLELTDSKCRIKNKKNDNHDDSLAELISEKSGSKFKRLKKETDAEESDESIIVRKTKQALKSKASKSISLIKDNSDMEDDSSGNEMNENSRATRDSLSKRLKGSRLSHSDVGNFDGEANESRSGIMKAKSKKRVIVSESDDSTDYNFSDKCKKSDVSNKNAKENEMSNFIESCETFSKNKDPKQNRKSARRRNALEMLQDDIREMFIGNEVALAFGQRKCTVKSQSDRKSEDAVRKRHANRTDARKSVSVKNSSEESDSDDELEKMKFLKCEKKFLKTKVSTRRDLQCQNDIYSCKNLRFLARRPCKEIVQEVEFSMENFTDSFLFCKKKPRISKNSRIKLQDVLGKLWSRVFKLGMNLQMGSDAIRVEDSEEKSNKLESNTSNVKVCENKSEVNGSRSNYQNRSDVMDNENNFEGKESKVVSLSDSAPTSAEIGAITIANKVKRDVENLSVFQEELPSMETLDECSNFHTANEIENNCIKAPLDEKEKDSFGHELTQDNLVKQTDQAVEPEKLRNVCGSDETLDENSCVTSNVDECDDTVSNISLCDSDVSEKGSEISLPESERLVRKRKAPRKNSLVKMTKGKRKKKLSSWQNGVIKKSTKTKQNKHPNELPSIFHDHPIASPPLIKEKLLDERTICGDYADPSYAIDGRGKYDCKFCNFSGVKIVPHYKTIHPDKEVCVSRLSIAAAEMAKAEAKNDIGGEVHDETDNSSVRRQKGTFVCRICHQFSEYIYDFYCHITTHTGEYDFKCDSCLYSSSNISGVKHHILLHHNEFSRTVNLKRGPPHTAKVLYGYLCSVCNFIQVLKENVETHITLRHQKDVGAEILRINMSIPLEEQGTTEIRGSTNAAGSTCEQRGSNEMFMDSTEGAGNDSAIVDHTNMEESASGSQPKRISSKNVPASMNPVVVLKGMKHLIEKGASNSSSKGSMLTTEQNTGTENEGNMHEEESVLEEVNLADDLGQTEVFQNRIANVQKPLPSQVTVGQVVTEENQTDGIELNADSASSINESSNVQSFCPARVENGMDEAMGTTPHIEAEQTHVPSATAENQVTQKEINVAFHAVENHALHDGSVPTTDVERVATNVHEAVSDGVENEEAVGKLLGTDLHSSEETGEKSPDRSETGTYKRSSLLERIEFLCAKSNASERHVDAATVTKHSKADGKIKKNVVEHAERSTITTRAATIARKQVCSVENADVNRVAVENDGALIGYSSVASPLSLPGLESVASERNGILRENLKDVGSDSPTTDSSDSITGPATTNLSDHNYIKVISTSLGMGMVTVKQENLVQEDSGTVGSNMNRLELYDVTSMPDPTITSICIGPMEARREGERILFCCRISGCNFQCPQVVKFACHYNTEHEKEWDGFCFLCGEVIDGIRPFCLEQAVEHLLTFHLTSKLKQKNRINRNNIKTRSPLSAVQKTNKVSTNNSFIDSPSTTNITTTCIATPSTFVTTSVITCTSSSVTSRVAAVSETNNGGASTNTSEDCNSLAETRAVADLLKNAVVIKNEPCDAELDNKNNENQELVRDPPAACLSASMQDERPRIRVRRISGDRLSLRTEETREPPVSPIVNPIEVRAKVERTDTEDTEQFAALDKDVSNDVSQSARSVLWPELSRAVCDESVLENSAGHCSSVLWGADTGGDASDAFPSIRIESVVSLNPEANIQENIDVVGDAEAGGHQSSSSPATSKNTYSRLQIDARSIAISSVPTSSNIIRLKPPLAQNVKTPMKRMLAPLKLKVLQPSPEPECAAAGLSKSVPRSPSRVAVIKPLSKEILRKDTLPAAGEKRATTALPQNKMQNTPRFVKNSKSPEAYRTMLETVKLQRLFKCMHSTCVFATSFEDRFVMHIKAHERLAGPSTKTKQQDFNRCAYCCKACQSVKDLVDHVLVEHGFCVYQCAYCFFRAMSPTYVLLHQRSCHVREAVAIIIDQRRLQMPELKDFPDKRENRRTVVLPYICAQGSCGMRFYQCDDFLMHLKREHTQLTIYSCHLCECKNIKPDALLSHYKWHCLYQYQCMYCLHGADSAVDMKHHLCTFHSDQPNKAIIRIFQEHEHQSHRLVEDLLTIDLDEGMDYSNLFVQCTDDENELDNLDIQVTYPQPGHLSPTTSESSFTLEGDDPPTPVVQAPPNKPGPKPKGNPLVVIGLEGHDLFHCGNKGCIHTSATSLELKDHLSMCDFARESSMMECAHCKKKFKTTTSLVDHLLSHGAERFCCSNCGFKSTMRVVVEKHCRQVHKFPAMRMDPVYTGEVNMDTMWYVIRPREKRKVVKATKVPEKKSFEPRDIHKLPDKDIFKEPVACSMCSFTTKVRVNMVRHLEMHEAEKRSAGSTVPSSCPVNPVPCLNRSEMMFDKMENLAASSQAMQAARLGADSQPVFVQERFRYVCGVADCRYMGCDEDMLRKHVFTLHTGEASYLCAHCKEHVVIDAEMANVLEHLRMHGGKLFRCTYCSFFHYSVAQVEKHAAAKHPNQPIVPITIRRVVD